MKNSSQVGTITFKKKTNRTGRLGGGAMGDRYYVGFFLWFARNRIRDDWILSRRFKKIDLINHFVFFIQNNYEKKERRKWNHAYRENQLRTTSGVDAWRAAARLRESTPPTTWTPSTDSILSPNSTTMTVRDEGAGAFIWGGVPRGLQNPTGHIADTGFCSHNLRMGIGGDLLNGLTKNSTTITTWKAKIRGTGHELWVEGDLHYKYY